VQRVQIALMVSGYDPGPVDGALSAKTREALTLYQENFSLPQTGYMDVQTLRLLGIIQ